MGSLAPFLPNDRRIALARGTVLPDRVQGSALFADMSGFTTLTGELFRELGGQRGAEEVIRQLNRVFDPLIVEIHRHGGSVVNFSGDAITCWFDDPEGGSSDGAPSGALRAVACGLRMQEVMGGLEALTAPSGRKYPLVLKVGVASGTARRFLVGDPGDYLLEVLAGATLDRVAAAEQMARGGEVVISARALRELPHDVVVNSWRGTGTIRYAHVSRLPEAPKLPPMAGFPQLDDELVRPWLLPALFSRLQQGVNEFQAELRPAVALFLKFAGLNYDTDDEAGAKLDAFVRRVQTVLNRYEGVLLQVTMGDKGSYLYAAFGAPIAHENDQARAAAAALELRDIAHRLPYLQDVKIGISYGTVHTGAYGSAERWTYGVVGNEVNISARLMTAAAPGQILISQRVADSVQSEFELRSLPPLRLKGVEGPFPVWELLDRGNAPKPGGEDSPDVVVVGRRSEQAVLEQSLAELATGQTSVLLLEGAPGIGKSLLARELAQKAALLELVPGENPGDQPSQLLHPVVIRGSGDAIERSTPYHGVRTILADLLGLDIYSAEPALDAVRERLLAELEPERRPFAPLLDAVLPLGFTENETTSQLADEARQDNTLRLIIELMQSAADGRPLVLIIDDVQWLDSPSWAFVRRAHRDLQPLLLVLVSRPLDDPPPVYNEFLGLPTTRRLILDVLPLEAVEELVCHKLGVSSLPAPVSKLIRTKAEGNPFFSEEIAFALRDSGLIEIRDGQCYLAAGAGDLEAIDFPDTVQGVITSRIDLLPPPQQLTVKVASVIGRIFAFRVLRDVYPVRTEVDGLRENLASLERLDITPIETPEPNLSHMFKHIVTQEVVYGLMTYAQRRQLHRDTALWYEQQPEAEAGWGAALLAHHWREAGDLRKAVAFYEQAGEAASRDYANEEAIQFLTAAVALSDDSYPAHQRARWHRLMAEAAYRLTRVEDSVAYYEEGLRLLGVPVHESNLGSGVRLVGQFGIQGIHRLMPRRMIGRAPAEERETLLEASRIYEAVSEVYYNRGDIVGSFYAIMTSFNLAEKAGPSPELVRGYGNMAASFANVGFNGPAESYRVKALALASELDDTATTARLLIPLGIYSFWTGRWDRAEEELSESLDIFTRMGDWRRWAIAGWIWPQIAESRGDLVEGRTRWTEFQETARRNGDTRHQVRSLGGLFFNHLALGQTPDAWNCLDEVSVLVRENPELLAIEERLWYAMNAAQALQQHDKARARQMAHEQLAAMGRARFKADLLDVFAAPAEVLLTLVDQQACEPGEAEQGCNVLNGFARTYAFARPRAMRARGRLAWLKGDGNSAENQWRKSLELAVRLDMPYERALTLRMIGVSLGDDDQIALAESLLIALGCDPATLSSTD